MACSPRGAAAAAAGVDGGQACGGGGGCAVARADAGGASSRPAKRVRAGSRCAEATSRFRGSNCRGCDPPRRLPFRRGSLSSDCPTPNFRLLKTVTENGFEIDPFPYRLILRGERKGGGWSVPLRDDPGGGPFGLI